VKTLVLVDIENICGTAIPSSQTVRIAKIIIDRVAKIKPDEAFYVLGCHDGLWKTITTTWPQKDSKGQINRSGFAHSGKDGADRGIVHWLHLNQHRRTEWSRIILVSGDHFFLIPLLAYAGPKTELIQISRNEKSRHHDYKKFAKRFSNIFLEDITSAPLPKLSVSQAGKDIDKWFANKKKAHAARIKATKDTSKASANIKLDSKKTLSQLLKVKSKPKPRTRGTKGNLVISNKSYYPVKWEKEYDWLFEDSKLYLSSKTYRTFQEAPDNSKIQLVLSDGSEISAMKSL
jgi:hypothetical protein